jgi:hypothetical protein
MKSREELESELDTAVTRAEELYGECISHITEKKNESIRNLEESFKKSMLLIEEKFQSQKKFYDSQQESMINKAKREFKDCMDNLKQREQLQKEKEAQKVKQIAKESKEKLEQKKKKEEEKKRKQLEKEEEKKKKQEEKESKKKEQQKTKLTKKGVKVYETPKDKKPLYNPEEYSMLCEELTQEYYPQFSSYEELYKSGETNKINRISSEARETLIDKNKTPEQIAEEKENEKEITIRIYNDYVSKSLVINENISDSIFQGALHILLDDEEDFTFGELYQKHLTEEEIIDFQYTPITKYNEFVMKHNPRQVDLIQEEMENKIKEQKTIRPSLE